MDLLVLDISFAQVETMLTDAEKERWWTLEIAPFAVEVRCPWYGTSSAFIRPLTYSSKV